MRGISRSWFATCGVIGCLLLVLFGAPRFAWSKGSAPQGLPLFVSSSGKVLEGLVVDQVEYLRLTDHLADRGPAPDVAPFTRRWLVPRLAAPLPVDAQIAVNIVNLVLLGAGLIALLALVRQWVSSPWVLMAVAVAYSASFPVLWYSTTSFVDAGAIGLVGVVLYSSYRRWWIGLLVLPLAVLAKESALVCVPFGMALEWLRPGTTPTDRRRWARLVAWPLVGLAALLGSGSVAATGAIQFRPWRPDDPAMVVESIRTNLSDPTFIAEVALSAAIPLLGVALAMVAVRRGRLTVPSERFVPLLVGVGAALALSLASLFFATWEGRTIWLMYPFALPLAAVWLDNVIVRTALDPARRRSRRRGVAALAVLGLGWPTLLFLGQVASAGRKAPEQPSECRFASRLADQLTTREVTVSGSGRGAVELPRSVEGMPWVARLDFDDSGRATLATAKTATGAGQAVLHTQGPYRGSVLVDVTAAERWLQVDTRGRWSVEVVPVGQMLQWNGLVPIDGDGDAVIVIPGGSRVDTSATLGTSAGSVVAVGRTRYGGDTTPGDSLIPRGSEAVVVRSDGPWRLRVEPTEAVSPGLGC